MQYFIKVLLLVSGDEVNALEAGCDAYISKPFDPVELLAKIRQYLP